MRDLLRRLHNNAKSLKERISLVRWSHGWRLVRSPGEPKARPVKADFDNYEVGGVLECGSTQDRNVVPLPHQAVSVDSLATSGCIPESLDEAVRLAKELRASYDAGNSTLDDCTRFLTACATGRLWDSAPPTFGGSPTLAA